MDYNPFNERQAGKIPASISSRHDVSDKAVRVYGVLAMFAGKNGLCFPGVEKIAAFAGKSIRRTQDALTELVEKKLITIERVKGKKLRLIKFITPDTSVLHTPDGFDNLTGRYRPSDQTVLTESPDSFDQVHYKDLKHSLKHSVKQSGKGAREREEPKVTTTATFRNPDGSVLKEVGEKMR